MRGAVATFDEQKGYGTVRANDGTEHFFHCTAIADGTRTIAPGTPVTFTLAPGHRGQWEAIDVQSGGADSDT
jgi:CspA family cold shock protein